MNEYWEEKKCNEFIAPFVAVLLLLVVSSAFKSVDEPNSQRHKKHALNDFTPINIGFATEHQHQRPAGDALQL